MFLQEIETSDVTDIDCRDHEEINKRIRHVQTIREQLRKRFRIEYLGQLKEQTQRHRKSRPLTVGVVVVVENSLKNRTLARADCHAFKGSDTEGFLKAIADQHSAISSLLPLMGRGCTLKPEIDMRFLLKEQTCDPAQGFAHYRFLILLCVSPVWVAASMWDDA
ncbi:hypothetical protein TNIN_216021 [Trichonephila inaurata madagascariensis]|uniref:Uncharacterized protein n=1 Tax=Trichonephila inaurata madagascariensis TaxID=2747483 RepID=A0A8X6MAI2_9ARAC|nr:hypothetical protein TNIN_216021 [Trichonephila inaurata madagascariensis]